MKIIKIKTVIEEHTIPKEIENVLIQKAKERTEYDKDFACYRKHEQLERIYSELYGDIDNEDNVQYWYIDC